MSTASNLLTGSVFASRYRIDGLLGAGGMGMVYRAWDQELDVRVALKVIRLDVSADLPSSADAEQRFKQELLMARQVTHRNVVRIHDLGVSDGVRYITMQFVEGSTLAALIDRRSLDFPRVADFSKQLTAGIAAAHEAGVIHRDLKPQNVLVDTANNLYVSDFGLAKSLEGVTMAAITRPGELIGTPHYMSPEQIQGKPSDHRSDLYALGLILFEMATGERLSSATSAMELMFQRVHQPAHDSALVKRGVPHYFQRVVMRCLERDPNARYQSARAVLAELEAENAVTEPAPRSSTAIDRLFTNRRVKLAAAALLIGAVALAGGALWRNRAASPGATASVSPQSTIRQVAVLPFKVIGDEASLLPIASGMTEALGAKLIKVSTLAVASTTAVERAATKSSLSAIAKALGSPLLISGTVAGSGNRLQVTVTMEDVERGQRLLAQDFSGVVGDILTLEDQVYSRIIAAMGMNPPNEETAQALLHPTENIQAYQLFLRGNNAMTGRQDIKNVEAALGFYEAALKQDPKFAHAYAGIANSALRMYRITKDETWTNRALSSALQARRLNDKLPEGHLALGGVYLATGKTQEAIAELTEAVTLNPRSSEYFYRLGRAYLSSGRGVEAIQLFEKATNLTPYDWINYANIGVAYMQLGDYEKALKAITRVTELDPENVGGHNDLGAVYLQLGRYEESTRAFERALALKPIPQTYTNLGISLSYNDKHAEGIAAFQKAVELSPNTDMFVGNLGDGYRWNGQADRAAAAYDKAIALGLKALQVNPRDAITRGRIALYYAKKKNDAQAMNFIRSARAIDRSNVNLMYSEMFIHFFGGRSADGLSALETTLKAGYPLSAVLSDPDLRPWKNMPEFTRLLEQFRPK